MRLNLFRTSTGGKANPKKVARARKAGLGKAAAESAAFAGRKGGAFPAGTAAGAVKAGAGKG